MQAIQGTEKIQSATLFSTTRRVVTRHDAVHLGIATQTDRDIRPVVKHVEAQDIWQSASDAES